MPARFVPGSAASDARVRPAGRGAALALAAALGAFGLAPAARAQVEAPVARFTRGQLWNAYSYAKTCATFNNWRRSDICLDWPGFDVTLIPVNVGQQPSYALSGGLWFAAKDSKGRVITRDDFAQYGTSVSLESDAKYRVVQHRKRYGPSGNWWLRANPNDAEEVLVSEWAANPTWRPAFAGDRQLPLRVRREVRTWSGSMADETFFLVEYTLTNTSDSTLYDAAGMVAYAFGGNTRSWNLLFPTLPDGARNNLFLYAPSTRTLTGFASNYPGTPADETFGLLREFGPNASRPSGGEYLAPAYFGLRFLDVTRNKAGVEDQITNYAFMRPDLQQDQQGPFIGKQGFDAQYEVIRNARLASNASLSTDGTSRIWSLFNVGPWDLAPGDSVKVAWAEIVDGAAYADAVRADSVTASQIRTVAAAEFTRNVQRAQLAYDNRYNLPSPPPAPPVAVDYDTQPGAIANVVTWPSTYDDHRDADYTGDEARDLRAYRLYRSSYLPIGPWTLVAEVPVGDARYLSGQTYRVRDANVVLGEGYYYALTAVDSGHDAWPVNPAARFPETGSNRVPPMESSLFANRTERPFRASLPATRTLDSVYVTPNPFVLTSGFTTADLRNAITFNNLPEGAVVRIYTANGRLLRTLPNDDGDGVVVWDQQTDNEFRVKSGVYFFHVTATDGRTRTGRFAIVQ